MDDLDKAFKQAAEWLREHELLKGRYDDSGGGEREKATCACMVGAVLFFIPTSVVVKRLAPRLGFKTLQDAFDWNDYPGTTKENVIARLERLAGETACAPDSKV